jgi:hypothetical protein
VLASIQGEIIDRAVDRQRTDVAAREFEWLHSESVGAAVARVAGTQHCSAMHKKNLSAVKL